MAAQKKLKLLYILKILIEETDENHLLDAGEISEILSSTYGIEAERKSIYNDVKLLIENGPTDFGVEIGQKKGSNPGYYVVARDFEVAELKMLVDAVQASKFISAKKSDELINKLEKLTNKYSAANINRQVHIAERVKSINTQVLVNIDCIHNAIDLDSQITFDYYMWNNKKKLVKKDKKYVVSPWCLVWAEEKYYLVCYDQDDQKIKYFRVDKMMDILATEKKRSGRKEFGAFDLSKFSKKTFGMFEGKDSHVTMVCSNDIAGEIIDRFGNGKDVIMNEVDKDHFSTSVTVAVSNQFFGWVTGLGNLIKLTGPEHVVEKYRNHLNSILGDY